MYDVIKSVIASGRYELSDMLKKIDVIWLQGELTDGQKGELVSLAQEKANPENSYAPLQKQINEMSEAMAKIVSDVKDLQAEVAKLKGEEVEPAPEPEEWPAWYKWNGVGRCPWQNESKCTHNGEKYISRVDNNIWEPGALGVHDTIWEKVPE